MIVCRRCEVPKPNRDFCKARKNKSGRQNTCKACRGGVVRAYELRTKYGLTVDEHEQMYHQQGGKCLGCGRPCLLRGRASIALVVDHDHETGEVRGLLCNPCNHALGHAQDNPTVLRQLAAYLEK